MSSLADRWLIIFPDNILYNQYKFSSAFAGTHFSPQQERCVKKFLCDCVTIPIFVYM